MVCSLFVGKDGQVVDTLVGLTLVDVMRAKVETLVALGTGNPQERSDRPTPDKL